MKIGNKGITLVILVITIIVLLILAGVSIAILAGENGILSKAVKAREEAQIKAYEDLIRLAITEENINQEQKTEKEKLEGIKEILKKDNNFKDTEITGPDENESKLKLIVKTKEGYIYYVYTNECEYKEKQPEETDIPKLTYANTTYTANPEKWTNGKVILTASTEITGYEIQTTRTPEIESSWKNTASQEFTENGIMYTRLWNGKSGGEYSSGNVTNIEKEKPTIESISSAFSIISGNTGKIIISGISDTGGSGLSGIYVSTNSTTPTETSVTWIANIESSFTYQVTTEGTYYVWVIDNAGNVSEAKSCKVTGQTAIAKVGTTYYSSIENAINSISSNGTITMCANTTESPTFPSNKTIVLDLNDKKIIGAVKNNGNLTIENTGSATGYIINSDDGPPTLYNYATGIVEMQEGVELDNLNSGYTLYNKGTFRMEGGVIRHTGVNTNTYHSAIVNNKDFSMNSKSAIASCVNGLRNVGKESHSECTGGEIVTTSSEHYAITVEDGGTANIKDTNIINEMNGISILSGMTLADAEESYIYIINSSITGPVLDKVGIIARAIERSDYTELLYYDSQSKAENVIFKTRPSGSSSMIDHIGRTGSKNGCDVFRYNLNKSEHNNTTGEYITDIYVNGSRVFEMRYMVN